jgi:hypothetical protein
MDDEDDGTETTPLVARDDDDISPPRPAIEWGVGPVRITSKDQRHILDRHRSGSWARGSRLFPAHWPKEKILAAVEATAGAPQNVVVEGRFVIRYRQIDGVIVRVTSTHFPIDAAANFESGSPHSGDGVITVDKRGKRERAPLDQAVLRRRL